MTMTRPHTIRAATPLDRDALGGLASVARSASLDRDVVEISIDGHVTQVPAPVALAIGDALEAFAAGHGVVVGSVDETVTTGQAARLLGISRTYLCTLVDDGVIPCQYVGTHRRLRTRDVVDYAERRRAQRQASLDEVSQLSASAGLYDDDL